MRRNEPVTQKELMLAPDALLVSRTDLLGNITYANEAFVEASGYGEKELIGQPHNLLRHPDVPSQVFEDMWATLESGMPWIQVVKNRCKNGDHYWVEAHVIPYIVNGEHLGYMSMLRPATREQVEAAEKAYAAIAQGKLRLYHGQPATWWRRFNPLENLNPSGATSAMVVFFSIPAVLNTFGIQVNDLWVQVSAVLLPILVYFGTEFTQNRLYKLDDILGQVAGGEFRNKVPLHGTNILNQIAARVENMQTRLAVSVDEATASLRRTQRVQVALEVSPSPVLVVDQFDRVMFTNAAMNRFLRAVEQRIRSSNPGFDAEQVVGHPVAQVLPLFAQAVAKARDLDNQVLTPRFGGHDLVVRVTAIRDQANRLMGVVIEWNDITEELSMQRAIEGIVECAQRGYLGRRLEVANAEGFYKNFSERFNAMLDSIGQAVAHINHVVMDAAEGKLGNKMDGTYAGQVGALQVALNNTFGNLGSIMIEVQTLMQRVARIVDQLNAASVELSDQAQRQAAALQQTNSTMQEITGSIREVDGEVRQAQDVVGRTARNAEQVKQAMAQTIDAMASVQQNSNRIEEIVSLIDGIAFQTNLLALNAAVEAARAGEHGKGFAVVAGEVRALAQKSSEAAQVIKNLIETTSEDIRSTSELVESTNTRLKTMVDGVLGMQGYLSKVVDATARQNQSVLEVSRAMTSIDNTTQQAAAHSEELAATSSMLQETTQSLSTSISVFKVDIRQLNMTRTVASGDFTIARARRLQRVWLSNAIVLFSACKDNCDMTSVVDEFATDLAKWMRDNKGRFGHLAEYAQLEDMRLAMHQHAGELVELKSAANRDADLQDGVERLKQLSNGIIEQITALEAVALT